MQPQTSSASLEEVFIVRVVCLDYYLAKPIPGLDICHSQLEGTAIERVPVVQIYGATPGGQKTCLHLHKAFPYFYVPYEDDFPSEPAKAQAFLRHTARTLEATMHAGQESGAQRHQRVFSVQLVRGCPFYGYHPGERLFMKIIMYNPMDVKKAAQLMQGGAILGRRLQPYEAHLPFLLQIKIDLNLAGMGWLRLSRVHCRVPLPDQHSGRRSGWRDMPTLVQYEQEVPGKLLCDAATMSGDASGSQDKWWTSVSMPTEWMVPPVTSGVVSRTLEKRSCCELEVDACVEHVLNRSELVRDKLENVGPDKRMVESLAPMWDEERQRCGGTGPPPPPPDPPRDPHPLCTTVDTIRAEFQAIADAHAQEVASASAADEEPAPPSRQPSQASSEKQPSARMSSSMPTSQDSLLRQTQAANLILSTEGPGTPHAESNVPGSLSPEAELGRFSEAGEALASFPGFPEAGSGLHGDVVQDCDADLRELLHKLQADESCSDEERDDRSRLEALVAAVASQPNAHRRLSQALSQMEEGSPRAQRAASQAQEEINDILEYADSPPGPSHAGNHSDGAAERSPEPGKRQRMTNEGRVTGHGWSMGDMEDLGGVAHGPVGPHHGRGAVWDGGGSAVTPGRNVSLQRHADVYTPGAQLGVFAGVSQESDFDWGAVSSMPRRPQQQSEQTAADVPNVQLGNTATEEVVMDSASEGEQVEHQAGIPQVDGAYDASDEEELELESSAQHQQASGSLAAASQDLLQRPSRATASGSQGSSQRYGLIPLQRASASTASAPTMLPSSSQGNSKGRRPPRRSRSMATGSGQERRALPRTAGSLQLDASQHSARRSTAALRPGTYRRPLGADAGTSRAPFRAPRRLNEPAPMPGNAGEAAADVGSAQAPIVPRGLGTAAPVAVQGGAPSDAIEQQCTELPEASLLAARDREVDMELLEFDGVARSENDSGAVPVQQQVASGTVAAGDASGSAAGLLPTKSLGWRARRWPSAAAVAPPQQDQINLSAQEWPPPLMRTSLDSSDPAAESAQDPVGGHSPVRTVTDRAEGAAAERANRRRESWDLVMRVAHASADCQCAILGSTSSGEEAPPSPCQHSQETPALVPEAVLDRSQPLQPPQLAADNAAPVVEPSDGRSGQSAADVPVTSPATKRRESREFVAQVAQNSAMLRQALVHSSDSEVDALPTSVAKPAPEHAPAGAAGTREDEAAAQHRTLDSIVGEATLAPFGSMVDDLRAPPLSDRVAGGVEVTCSERHGLQLTAEEFDAGIEQSDGPLAAWHELQEGGCGAEGPLVASTSEMSINVVGVSSQEELISKREMAPVVSSLAKSLTLRPTTAEIDLPAAKAAVEEVAESGSSEGDIEIDFGSQSPQTGPREPQVTKVASTAADTMATRQTGQGAELQSSLGQPSSRHSQPTPSSPELQLCLDLSLSSKRTDASASPQPHRLFPLTAPRPSPEQPLSAHDAYAQPAGSQAGDRNERQIHWQALERRRADLVAFRPRARPPTQQELDNTMLAEGVPAVVHQPAFYGRPEDVPQRPAVWAGLEFKVPSGATSALPPFRAGSRSAAAVVQKGKANRQQQPGRIYAMTPVQLPPSRAETDAWLEAERDALLASQHSHGSTSKGKSGSAASNKEQAFGMDANTGRLLPGGGQGGTGSQDSGGSDLLETPALCSMPSQHRRAPGPSRLRIATQQSADGAPADADEEEIRPASPKYDERSFFYTTPKLNPARPAFQRQQPTTPWATPTLLPQPQAAQSPSGAASAASPAAQARHSPQQVPDTPVTPAANIRRALPPPPNFSGQIVHNARPAPDSSDSSAAHHVAAAPAAAAIDKLLGAPDAQALAAPADVTPVQEAGANVPQQGPKAHAANPWTSQITAPSPAAGSAGATPVSQSGFRRLVAGKGQNLTLLSIEVHADTRGTLLPDPRYDAIRCVVLAAADDAEDMSSNSCAARVMLFDDKGQRPMEGLPNVQVEVHGSEEALLDAVVAAVRALDPDILVGYEVQQGSLGYLNDRATALQRSEPLLRQLSRTPQVVSMVERRNDEYGVLHASGIHVAGRIVLNLWRLLRSELKLRIYTFEACVAAVLQLRTPHTPAWVLSQWFQAGPAGGRWRCVQYIVRRARLSLAMMEQLDITGRTGEMARAFGIDFFSVLTRGSQYRVEAMMARLAHTQNYLLPAPSVEQTKNQPAMEAIPLVMEPESRLYVDPVIVLDFQSLYPSQIIAYNLCFSTCLGRPAHAAAAGARLRLGAQLYGLPKGSLSGAVAPDKLIVAPNGVAYAPPEARQGVLPRLLSEILATRIMVKAAMKRAPKTAKVLQRILNARQFSLKLIANVTYGYTAAGFSGRMPMAELADSIVQSGRETLENTIRMVEGHPEWRARVVYGDTDSLFVLLEGRSREEAFRIGAEIAAAATAANPPPVTLKMEKVYHPCVLLTKKRYVGFMYEAPKQAAGVFDAKGIETVRRDTCSAVAKMLERSLRILFTSKDVSQVKEYVERQWTKILSGRVSLADFVFAKEVRLGTYRAANGLVPPAAMVASKALATDPRAEPRYGERVPYVIVHGEPGARLVDMAVTPHALIESGGRLRLHAHYYINKQILPALERVFSLLGVDVRGWYTALPRPQRLLPQKRPAAALGLAARGSAAGTIDAYYLSRHCAVCDGLTHAQRPICEECRMEPQGAAMVLSARAARLAGAQALLVRVCLHCGGGGGRKASEGGIVCDSLDCGVFFERRKATDEAAAARVLCDLALQDF
ncbi:probable DNA polymerase zeta catalytic subunit [Coccomyxa sp. Obi]|nr:probable DNA polymerase zeta catalytic subunit [Coccomyxa sp. Obi]